MMGRKRWYWVVTGLVVLLCAAARSPAGPTTTDSWIARFEIPEQSIWERRWGPGDSENFLSESAVVEDPTSRFYGSSATVNIEASSGTVSGNVEGQIEASYPSYLPDPGPVNVGISYAPIEGEGQIHTQLGAQFTGKATAKVDLPGPFDIDRTVALLPDWIGFDVKEDFTASLGATGVASGASAPIAAVSVGAVIAGGSIQGNLYQEVFFTPWSIVGSVEYTYLGTPEWEQKPIVIDFVLDKDHPEAPVELHLDEPGYWEVEVTELTLHNTFSHKIGGRLTASAWLAGAGDVYRENVNLEFWDNWPGYELIVPDVRMLGRFNIYVDGASAPAAVPVPGAVWLLGSGLFVLAAGRRRCLRWIDSH